MSSPLGEYLRARRALLQPEDVGLLRHNARRVQGLRREEVARLAGVSQEYYLRLEQGRDRQPSDQVVSALAKALSLDDAATTHLHMLARRTSAPAAPRPQRSATAQLGLQALLDSWAWTPSYIVTATQDVLLANDLARNLGPRVFEPGVNLALALFSEPIATRAVGWDERARRMVEKLRFHSDPDDPRLAELGRRLSLESDLFRTSWDRHDVAPHWTEEVRIDVEGVGDVALTSQSLLIPGWQRLALVALHAKAGTEADDALESVRRRINSPRGARTTLA